MSAQFSIGVFGIILDAEDRVLLCHRKDYDLWNLPGGGLEAGESPWEGVVREVEEETGFKVRVVKLTGVYSKPEKNDVVFAFLCEIIGGELLLNDEADQIEYFSLASIPPNTVVKQVERIKDYIATPNEISLKVQVGKSSIEMLKDGEQLNIKKKLTLV